MTTPTGEGLVVPPTARPSALTRLSSPLLPGAFSVNTRPCRGRSAPATAHPDPSSPHCFGLRPAGAVLAKAEPAVGRCGGKPGSPRRVGTVWRERGGLPQYRHTAIATGEDSAGPTDPTPAIRRPAPPANPPDRAAGLAALGGPLMVCRRRVARASTLLPAGRRERRVCPFALPSARVSSEFRFCLCGYRERVEPKWRSWRGPHSTATRGGVDGSGHRVGGGDAQRWGGR